MVGCLVTPPRFRRNQVLYSKEGCRGSVIRINFFLNRSRTGNGMQMAEESSESRVKTAEMHWRIPAVELED